jgi:nucleotide-binding universal stress UspA family protein
MNYFISDQGSEGQKYVSALDDFRRARSRAFLKELVARIRGESIELLSYEEVRQQLRAYASSDRGLQDIPLDAIVGSVGRYNDFTRDFLPRQDANKDRWARVMAASETLTGLPPIDVYKIGDIYFVQDGNHRVSVARQLGAKTIQGFVTEVQTRVPISPDTRPDELIVKAEYAEFLERTHLDELRPEADLSVTVPGQYPILEEHIAVHRHYMGNEQKRFIPEEEAVTHWYDHIYLPVIQAIREAGILRNFPNRTETDLYLWIAEYRASLEKEWGTEIKTEVAVLDLLKQEGREQDSTFGRIGGKILEVISPGILESGPPTGQWREESRLIHHDDRLFTDILVPVNGEASGWYALDQALVIAQNEGARLHGLHIVAEEDVQSEAARAVQSEFARRCQEKGQQGHLILTSGEVAPQISVQARLTDLVVTTLLYPPPPQLLARIDSGFRDLIQRCPRPVLAVPQVVSPLKHALLAYDGSPKADEALFVATYLAGRWQIHLTVVTVFDQSRVAPETLLRAQVYLEESGIQADYFAAEEGPVAEAILKAAEERQADMIIMGGYGFNPVLGMILGSAVDQVLREARKPVLICR